MDTLIEIIIYAIIPFGLGYISIPIVVYWIQEWLNGKNSMPQQEFEKRLESISGTIDCGDGKVYNGAESSEQ